MGSADLARFGSAEYSAASWPDIACSKGKILYLTFRKSTKSTKSTGWYLVLERPGTREKYQKYRSTEYQKVPVGVGTPALMTSSAQGWGR